MPGPTTKFQLKPDAVFQPMDDEAIIVSLDSEEIFKLNLTSTEIVRLIEADLTLEQILTRLQEQFDVAAEVLEAEVIQLLDQLLEAALIEESSRK